MNRAFAEFYGEPVEEIERAGRCRVWSAEDEIAIKAGDEEVFAGRAPFSQDERVVDALGRVHFITRTKLLIGRADQPDHLVLCIAIDHTERQQYEMRRRAMEKLAATGRMAARVAHEINNPLAGIKSAFRLLRDDIPSTSENYHYVGRIEREIDRIALIVRQMFDLYRPPSDICAETDLAALLDDVVHLLQPQLRERDLKLEVEGLHARSVLRVDDALLRPVVFNLLQNAIEASPAGGRVGVRVENDVDRLHFTVVDEGPGIDESIRARVFEPFFTTKVGLATGGIGLGLSIAQSTIESLGGTLDFRPRPTGGTAFRISLPVGSATAALPSSPRAPRGIE